MGGFNDHKGKVFPVKGDIRFMRIYLQVSKTNLFQNNTRILGWGGSEKKKTVRREGGTFR